MFAGRNLVRWTGCVIGLTALNLLVGCAGADADKIQISALQNENMRLMRENADLKQRLAAALADADSARARASELQAALDAARSQIASVPRLPEGWQNQGGVAWRDFPEQILFDSGKADLKASGHAELEKLVAQIRGNAELAGRGIWVVGHTDTDPIKHSSWKDNLELSVQRGATVTRDLYKLGLDPKTVVAAGQGEYNPKVPNDSRTNKAQNRRVQIIAIQRPPGGMSSSETITPASDTTIRASDGPVRTIEASSADGQG